MQKHLPSVFFLCFFSFSLIFLACDKEEIKNYSKYPIDFKLEQLSNGGFKYSWNAINTSDFKEYWIVRNSVDSVPYININNPDLLSAKSSIIARITDASLTEIIDTVTLFNGKNFVRIFAFLENRALSSLSKEVKGLDNIFEINKRADNIIFDKKSNLFYGFDAKLNQILSINPSTLNTSSSNAINNIDFSKEIYLYESTGNSQLYTPIFNGNYAVLSLPSFNFFASDNFFLSNISMLVGRNTFIVAGGTKNDLLSKSKSNVFVQFSNSVVLKSLNKLNLSPLVRWNSTNNEVLALTVSDSTSILNVVSLSSNGGLSLKSNLPLTLKSKTAITTNFILTPNNSFILLDEAGLIIEPSTLEKKGTLAERAKVKDVKYLSFCFSTDEKFVYALRDANRNSEKNIDVFNYPSFDYVKSISYKSKPKQIFYHDNKLKLVGESPNNTNFTMFEVIKP